MPYMAFESWREERLLIREAPIPEHSAGEKRERVFHRTQGPLTLLGAEQ